jgi:hypothetical protein
MSRSFAPSASGEQAAMTREEKIRALQDADRTRGDRDRVIFAAALVADYLPVPWADKLLASWNLSLSDLGESV